VAGPRTLTAVPLSIAYGQLQPMAAINGSSEFSQLINSAGKSKAPVSDHGVENKLAQMLLGNLVETMLPESISGLGGNSLSLDYWSSLFANSVADVLSGSGKLDLKLSRE
jgi:hypothetical protein